MAIQSFKEAYKHDNMDFKVFTHENGIEKTHEGFFANVRIDRKTLPAGWHAYDIRDDDSNGDACEIRNGYIMINHLGTFATKDPLPLEPGESLYYNDGKFENEAEEFDYSFS